MPTYLLHGFRWQRASIRIHIIVQDLEDAAAEWIVAPATSMTILNSFYSLYDFLPPSNPPPTNYPLPGVAVEKVVVQDEHENIPPQTLAKEPKRGGLRASRSMRNLRRIGSAAMLRSNGHDHKFGEGARLGDAPRVKDGALRSGSRERPKTSAERPKTSAGTSPSMDTIKVERKLNFNDWSAVKLMEQYDPNELSVSQPYAYVADYMIEVTLSASLMEEMLKYEARIRKEESFSNHVPPVPAIPVIHTAEMNPLGDLPTPPLSARHQRARSRKLGWFEKLRDGLQKESDIGWYVVVCEDEERAIPSMESNRSQLDLGCESDGSQRPKSSAGLKGFFHRRRVVQHRRPEF